MPILRLVAEGVGPFERIDVDFSDGNGNPHLGPHIVVGTNGTGKSTLLRTIAWGFASVPQYGFDFERWKQLIAGHSAPRALLALKATAQEHWLSAYGRTPDANTLTDWASRELQLSGGSIWAQSPFPSDPLFFWMGLGGGLLRRRGAFFCATYSPNPNLQVLVQPDISKRLTTTMEGSLAFDRTVDNEKVQAWLMRLYSERAIAATEQLSQERAAKALAGVEGALCDMFESQFRVKLKIPEFELRLETPAGECNVSQLPDGLRSTLAWCSDFLMRQDNMQWMDELKGRRPSILLIDEIESHLHPHWQRRILPGLRKALPDVQIIVTTHSPFVASSCPGAKLHICERDGNKPATIRTETSPFGQKLLTTISGVFGIDSRFDVATERDLNEWYGLKRRQATLTTEEHDRLSQLSRALAERSEELRAIVAGPDQISPQSVTSLLEATSKKRRKVKS